MRILHLPTSVGGNAWGLSQGERRIGLDSVVLEATGSRFDYPSDISLHWERKGNLGVLLSSLWTFLKYRRQFDIFHFNFGSTLIDFRRFGIHHRDLPFYPKGKKMVFTYNGCDARQKHKTMERARIAMCHETECYQGMCNDGAKDRMRAQRIKAASRYAHHIFALNPDLLYFLPPALSSFLPYTVASWYQIQAVPFSIGRTIRVTHSPTNRAAKGSRYILQALENLKKKYPLEIVIVENLPYSRALAIYEQSHLIIDQVLAGWYGGLAVEGMKMGKPVCVYIREEDLKFIPEAMANDLREAVINVEPQNIETVLEGYLQNLQWIEQKGKAGLEYVHRWHDPMKVAQIAKSVYESRTP